MPSVMLQCKTEARCSHPSRAAQFLLKLRPTACSFLFSKVSQRCCVQLLLLQYLLRNVTARVGGEKWPLQCHYSRQVTKPEGSADVLIPYKWKASKDDIFVLFILSKVCCLFTSFFSFSLLGCFNRKLSFPLLFVPFETRVFIVVFSVVFWVFV